MKVSYDPAIDTLRILLCDAPIQATETHHSGLIFDYDHNGRIVGLELTSASEHMSRPHGAGIAGMIETLSHGGE